MSDELTYTPAVQAPEESELDRALADIGTSDTATIRVHRIRHGKTDEFCGTFSAQSFTMEMLQETYGGGDYQLEGREKGKYQFRRRVAIAEPKIEFNQKQTSEHQQTGAGVSMDAIASMLREQQQNFQSQMMQFMLLMNRNNQAQKTDNTRREMLEEIQMIQQIFGGGKNDMGAEHGLELIKKGFEFAKDINGGETNNSDVLLKALETFSGPLSDALQVYADEKRGTVPNNPVDVQRSMTGRPAPKPNGGKDPLRPRILFLINAARRGGDPGTYADLILDQVSDDTINAFFRQNPDPVAALARIEPSVEHYRDWFKALADEIQAQLSDDEDQEHTSDATQGDGAHG